jgi:hypothetical protein
MGQIIAVFDISTGNIHGFRDFNQACEFLHVESKRLKDALNLDGAYLDGFYVSSLILHKSNRGGRR